MFIIKGIPPSKRGEFWFVASGAKRELKQHPNYYSYFVYLADLTYNSLKFD